MLFNFKQFLFTATALLSGMVLQSTAEATDYSNSAAYNAPIGMQAGQENATVNPSLRDSNGNLTVVNGQFTSSAMSSASGVSSASAMSASSGMGGVGTSGSGTMYGGATAIGNQLNVVTVGSNNTVIVNSNQTNNGNQNASVSLNGH
jgi:holdfast attachment protein HfaA